MGRVKFILDHTVHHVVLDRLPLESWTAKEAEAVFWALGSLLGRPVQQKWTPPTLATYSLKEQSFLYDVQDSGQVAAPNVRRSITNIELSFHNDNCFNPLLPHYVGLLCLHPAQSGGHSRLISAFTVHQTLQETYADLLPRLYKSFWFNRQGEHPPQELPFSRYPVFAQDTHGSLQVRCNSPLIDVGYALAEESIDDWGQEALAALETVMNMPSLWNEMHLQRGQMQWINNRKTLHARTQFVDGDTECYQRHLLRMWLRNEASANYMGTS
jgi:alpha-ketoglutarate-dependent taurine dioxygenase